MKKINGIILLTLNRGLGPVRGTVGVKAYGRRASGVLSDMVTTPGWKGKEEGTLRGGEYYCQRLQT